MQICYFTNVYPAPSHTTMRREILALEALGVSVLRAASRPYDGPLIDPNDRKEAIKTRYVAHSVIYAAICLVIVATTRPRRLSITIVDAIRVGFGSKRGVFKHLMYLGQACVLLRLTRSCIHIHANFSNATSIATMCHALGGPRVSLRIHGPEEFDDFTADEWNWRFSHADFVAPISEYGVQRLKATLPVIFHSKIKLLRCGVDTKYLTATHTKVDSLPTQLRLVCVARLEPRKGLDILLLALSTLMAEGLSVSLQLIGAGTCLHNLEHQVQELGLNNAVELTGWRSGSDVADAIRNARVIVLPSFSEGLPIVLMEAFALGRTVVSTRIAGTPELVIHGENGWLVEPGDVTALASALKDALLSPDEKLVAMGKLGQSLVASRHDTNKLMKELIAWICASEHLTYPNVH